MNSSHVGAAKTIDGLPEKDEKDVKAILLADLKAEPGETIVILHGAIISPLRATEMTLLAIRLRRLGYKVVTFCYPSLIGTLTKNVATYEKFLNQLPYDKVHIVAHSMGGVLTREVLEKGTVKFGEGRVVALGSPFVECWLGRRGLKFFGRWAIGETVYEHIGRTIETTWGGQREMGIVAGTFPLGVGQIFRTMPHPHDGIVVWEETRLKGVTDHITLDVNHLGLLITTRAFYQIAHFLKKGKFTQTKRLSEVAPVQTAT